jgi:hypothetical protein
MDAPTTYTQCFNKGRVVERRDQRDSMTALLQAQREGGKGPHVAVGAEGEEREMHLVHPV